MSLNFKAWLYEIRHSAVINPEVKKWVDSADKLKQTIEKLKSVLKDKEKKPIKIEPEKKKPEPEVKKPEKKSEPPSKRNKIDLKNIQKPTKIDKAEERKGLDRNDKP